MAAMNQRQRLEVTPVQQEAQSPKVLILDRNMSHEYIPTYFCFQTPPSTYKRQIDIHYGSLPRQQFVSNGGLTAVDNNANPANGTRRGVAFGKGISSLLGVRARGHSVPNLGERSDLKHATELKASLT